MLYYIKESKGENKKKYSEMDELQKVFIVTHSSLSILTSYTKRQRMQLKHYIKGHPPTLATNSLWVGLSDINQEDRVKLKEQIYFHLKAEIIIKHAKKEWEFKY